MWFTRYCISIWNIWQENADVYDFLLFQIWYIVLIKHFYIYFVSVYFEMHTKCNIWCIHQIAVLNFNWLQINGTRFWKTGTRQIIKEFSNCKLMISCKFHFCKVIRETTYHFTIIYMSCLFTQRLITYFAISLNK